MKRSLAALVLLVALPATALAVLPAGGGTVDLATTFDAKLRGDAELAGNVSGVGDFTADRGADLAVVQKNPRAVRVVHGGAFDGERGFNAVPATLITSASRTVTAVAGAGDVNGDATADLVIGSCDPAAADPGRAWVVFGRAGTASIDLDNLGTGGFAVNGAGSDCLGRSVAGAGDFNGDGKGDVILGAHKSAGNSGRALVVLGPSGATSFDLTGPSTSFAGTFVAGLGDVNGDGKADAGVGAPGYDSGYGVDSGAAWVVHGRTATTPVTLESDGAAFRIDGGADGARLGPIAGAGDHNKDGKADVAVGAPGPNVPGVVGIVFGRTATTALTTGGLGTDGYRFTSTSGSHRFGFEVRGGGDVNADGIPDVLAGAPDAPVGQSPEKLRAGKAFVLFGRGSAESPVNVDSDAFTAGRGVRILGTRGEETGAQTQDPTLIGYEGWLGVGDANCDGVADVLLGTGAARISGGGSDPGALYVLRGNGGGASACGAGPAATPTPAPTATPGPGGGDGRVVQIRKASLKNRRMRVGRRPTAISSARKKPPFGTIVRFDLSEPATVRFRITCRRPKGKLKAFCKKLAKKDTLTRRIATAGASTLSFTGRIGRRALRPGTYAITLVASDADGSSPPRALRFAVVSR